MPEFRQDFPTPVFLISFNRAAMLKKAVSAIRGLSRAAEIVIHDNGSSDPETLVTLGALEETGIAVFRYPPINSADDLNRVDETVQAFFSSRGRATRYVVSDCDIDMSISAPQALDVYDELLDIFSEAECVGPMLRIRDIPRAYPLFNLVMNRHIEQFWHRIPKFVHTTFGRVAVLEARIDTTFALHRAGEPFRRLKKGLRVYEPFEALHLDWYETQSERSAYFDTSSQRIAHWGNRDSILSYQSETLSHDFFYTVRQRDNGSLEVVREDIGSHENAPTR